MSLANSSGPRWIRRQKVAGDKALAGVAPIRRFLAALFGRSPNAHVRPRFEDSDDGTASVGKLASRPLTVPALAGGAKTRLEDGSL